MPEIKHNFTTGKMNKDLDERLVQNGEYRDAINIQVSTSDESNVGSVQNILGNNLVADISYLNSNCVCIGSIADEKNDKIYWFVYDNTTGTEKSYILQYDKTSIIPVFVDTDNSVLKLTENKLTAINIIDDLLFFTDGISEPKKINIQKAIAGTDVGGLDDTEYTDYTGTDVNYKDITVIKKAPINAPTIQYNYFRDPSLQYAGFINISDSPAVSHTLINSSRGVIFNFDSLQVGDTFQTIIETDENFSNNFNLAWQPGTDVVLEAFSIDNTPPIIPLQNYDIKGFITDWSNNEFSNSETEYDIEQTLAQTDWNIISTNEYSFAGTAPYKLVHYFYYSSVGNQISDNHRYRLTFELAELNSVLEGKLVVRLHDAGSQYYEIILDDLESTDAGVKEYFILENEINNTQFQNYPHAVYFEAGIATTAPNARFEGIVKNVQLVREDVQTAKVEIEITSLPATPPNQTNSSGRLNYAIDIYEDYDSIFNSKFSRIAYRYKYKDNEYSFFSPFSQAIFSPGTFRYDPVEAYNLGMENTIKDIVIKNLDEDLPGDVESIDILYKEDNSTAVYLIDTIKTSNQVFDYNLSSDTIKGILPENQLLRNFDNVPIKAKAQEVVGNRIVYGNYQQNYDLKYDDSGTLRDFELNINTGVKSTSNASGSGLPSIKSARKYQVGVVYSDEYGRQTPVISNSDSTDEVQLLSAGQINTYEIRINSMGHPVNAKYFKFYVKDIGGDYFNLAMDRWYDAEDGNVWLSFPSSDRNKLDIDDYLLLKKGIENNVVDLTTENKYKVIDIQNEAPRFIKANEMLISKKRHSNSVALFDASQGCEIPAENGSTFSVLYSRYNNSALSKLVELFNSRTFEEDFFIQLSLENINGPQSSSNKYKLFNLELTTQSPQKLQFSVEGSFGTDISQFNDDPLNTGSATQIVDGVFLSIFKRKIENSAKFEGRFFVKILRDQHYDQFISTSIQDTENVNYTTSASTNKKIYYYESVTDTRFNTPDHHGSQEFFGLSSTEDDYTEYTTNGYNNFQLGETATDPPNAPAGNLKDYIESTYSVIDSLADFDYGGSSDDPNYTEKGRGTILGLRAWFRGINTELDPDKASSNRIDTLHIENDRDNNNFEDVWYFNSSRVSTFYPYYAGFEVSQDYPIKNSSVVHDEWKTKTAINNFSSTSIINIAFGGIEPEQSIGWAAANYPYRDLSFFDLVNHSTFSGSQGAFIKKIAAGSQFRFKEDPAGTIYTINDVIVSYMVTYDNLCEDAGYDVSSSTYTNSSATNVNQFLGNKNIVNNVSNNNAFYDNEYSSPQTLGTGGGANQVFYRVPSFLNACNFAVNYQIALNKPVDWNPVGTPGTEIPGGITLTIPATANPVGTHASLTGLSTIELDSITGTTDSGDETQIQEGMVLESYNDDASTNREITKKAIVTDINFDPGTNKFTVKFRAYSGDDEGLDSGTGTGKIDDITAADELIFKQYYMNGMCPNSVKNLNFFRKGGESLLKTGVAPLGYTIEFLTISEEENELSPNPAVWETEPKEEKKLDIYYEASDYFKITTTTSDLASIIPVGSIVEHANSGAIPLGTTITNFDPATGTITLSNDAAVEPSGLQPSYITDRFN